MATRAYRDTSPPRPARQPRSESVPRTASTAVSSSNIVDRIVGARLKRRLDAEGAQPIPLFEVADEQP